MADIFISYKKEDAGRVIRLVEALRADGFSVWWDHGIQAGSEWDRSIREELDAARIVVAVWSRSSINAPWVKEEANVGKTRGKLVPVKIDPVEPPLGFTLIQAADLVGWRGDPSDPRWGYFLGAVRAALSGERPSGLETPLRHPPARTAAFNRPMLLAVAGIAAVLALMVVGALLFLRAAQTVQAPPTPTAVTPAAVPTPAAPQRAEISPGEQQLWDIALSSRSRQAFQSYLLAYPNGAFAQRARDILLTCRTETKEVWKAGPSVANQMVRGVASFTSGSGGSNAQACESAKTEVRERAKLMCETIVVNGGFRNAQWTVGDQPCKCEQTSPVVTVCIADLAYSCRWEQKETERLEICG